MIRIGIIGVGMMGRTHYESYAKLSNACVTAIADIDPKRAAGDLSGTQGNVLQGGLTQLPMDRIFGTQNYRDLLARADIDVIDVCTPTPLHVEMVLAALKAGKHVISEKPLARTIAEGKQIAKAAAAAKVFHMPAMCIRFWPEWAWLKKAIAERRYGAVRSATFRRVATRLEGWYSDGALSGGGVLDLHVHDTDFVNYLFGMPKAVFSRGYSEYSGEIDHLVTQYVYEEVPLVTGEGGWTMAEGHGFRMQYTVNFEKATAEYDLGRAETLMLYRGGKKDAVECAKESGYEAELRYFVDCVEKKQRPTVVTAEDGVMALQIVEAEKESIANGAMVKIGR